MEEYTAPLLFCAATLLIVVICLIVHICWQDKQLDEYRTAYAQATAEQMMIDEMLDVGALDKRHTRVEKIAYSMAMNRAAAKAGFIPNK